MQEFEKIDNLAVHIERMASSGNTGTPSEWSDFLVAFNDVTQESAISVVNQQLEFIKGKFPASESGN